MNVVEVKAGSKLIRNRETQASKQAVTGIKQHNHLEAHMEFRRKAYSVVSKGRKGPQAHARHLAFRPARHRDLKTNK